MMVGIWTTEGQQMISIYFTRVHFYFLKESERSNLSLAVVLVVRSALNSPHIELER